MPYSTPFRMGATPFKNISPEATEVLPQAPTPTCPHCQRVAQRTTKRIQRSTDRALRFLREARGAWCGAGTIRVGGAIQRKDWPAVREALSTHPKVAMCDSPRRVTTKWWRSTEFGPPNEVTPATYRRSPVELTLARVLICLRDAPGYVWPERVLRATALVRAKDWPRILDTLRADRAHVEIVSDEHGRTFSWRLKGGRQ
jgi:hypothetical protein